MHISLRRLSALAGTVALATIGLTGTPAHAATASTIYAGGTGCVNTNGGSQSQPWCTISQAAAKATVPGTTVQVNPGTYAEKVTVAASGQSGAPITVAAATPGTVTVTGGGFVVSGRSFVVVSGFVVTNTTSYGFTITSSNNITLSGNTVTHAGQRVSGKTGGGFKFSSVSQSVVTGNVADDNSDHGFYFTSSSNNVVSYNEASGNAEGFQRNANGINFASNDTNNVALGNTLHDNEDTGLQFYPGSSGNTATLNISYHNGDHGIDNLEAKNTLITGNTVERNWASGINVESRTPGGASAAVTNNISRDNNPAWGPCLTGTCNTRTVGNIRVDANSLVGSSITYNVVYNTPGMAFPTVYVLGTTSYTVSTLSTFLALGWGSHDLYADPLFVADGSDFRLQPGSPAIDSADSSAGGEQADGRVDDPDTANTGAGTRDYDDRGARERVPVSAN